MTIVDDIPDLSHWKTAQEFSITEAALLLSGIDPYDYPTLEYVRNKNHERWKKAWGLANGIVTAIRRGLLSPVECITEIENYDNFGNVVGVSYTTIHPTDRTYEICKDKTVITRISLHEWVRKERVDFVRRVKYVSGWSVDAPQTVINATPEPVNNTSPLLLPYEHKSEGLEFVQDAIKELWSTYDEDNPQTAPTKKEVIDYLTERGAGYNMADAVNLILRPYGLKGIGRRAKKSNR
ncbi:hypothetical protein KE423_002991 [Salmonella enterica]|nr:hypothetical protein [Salmonella enterica]